MSLCVTLPTTFEHTIKLSAETMVPPKIHGPAPKPARVAIFIVAGAAPPLHAGVTTVADRAAATNNAFVIIAPPKAKHFRKAKIHEAVKNTPTHYQRKNRSHRHNRRRSGG
jgi:hypothetical protein